MNRKNRLRMLRQELNLTQLELGKKVGVSKSNISKYEAGDVEIGNELLFAFAELFGVTTDYLLGFSNIREPYDVQTIAAHHDADEFTEEELRAIEEFKETVKRLRGK